MQVAAPIVQNFFADNRVTVNDSRQYQMRTQVRNYAINHPVPMANFLTQNNVSLNQFLDMLANATPDIWPSTTASTCYTTPCTLGTAWTEQTTRSEEQSSSEAWTNRRQQRSLGHEFLEQGARQQRGQDPELVLANPSASHDKQTP